MPIVRNKTEKIKMASYLEAATERFVVIFKVHIPPLTKFRPENSCRVKRSHAKNFRNRTQRFPTIKLF